MKRILLFLQNKKVQMRGSSGQIAIMLIVVIAVALVFYAVSLNIGQIAQRKIGISKAAHSGASQLASAFASYGQQTMNENLEGKWRVKETTINIAALVSIAVAAAATIASGGSGGPALVAALAAAAAAAGSVIVETQIVAPKLTQSWNSQMMKKLPVDAQFLEQGISSALVSAVEDRGVVLDFYDRDSDTIFYNEETGEEDYIARYSHYYGERLGTIQSLENKKLMEFLSKTKCFIFGGGNCQSQDNSWALTDSTTPAVCRLALSAPSADIPSVCNPCCASKKPKGCDALQYGNSDICAKNSPYGEKYPWVYDPLYQNPTNNMFSLIERIGFDDKSPKYYRSEENIINPLDPVNIKQEESGDGFIASDVSGFFDNSALAEGVLANGAYLQKGIFSLFYKVEDWEIDLDVITESKIFGVLEGEFCFWLDNSQGEYPYKCADDWGLKSFFGRTGELGANFLYKDLALPIRHRLYTGDVYGPRYNTRRFVDNNKNTRIPDIDKVKVPTGIIAQNSSCASTADTEEGIGFWKRGDDSYCSFDSSSSTASYPYDKQCPKHETEGCAEFDEDVLDDIVGGLREFAGIGQQILSQENATLLRTFDIWYPFIASWLEPKVNTQKDNCYLCKNEEKEGYLYILHNKIAFVLDRLTQWRDTSYVSDDAWCVPEGVDEEIEGEKATFDSNNNGIRGDMEDVVACLSWNSSDRDENHTGVFAYEGNLFKDLLPEGKTALPAKMTDGIVQGNASKYEYCALTCSEKACDTLPRSLVSDYEPTEFSGNLRNTDREGELENLLSCFYVRRNADGTGCSSTDKVALRTEIDAINPKCVPDSNQTFSDSGGQRAWIDKTRQSAFEAALQVAKFEQRRLFLEDIWNDLTKAITVLKDADDKFSAYLEGGYEQSTDEVSKEINGAIDLMVAAAKEHPRSAAAGSGLPRQAIYAWQDDLKEGQAENTRAWHIVRVDGRIPGRCNNACYPDQNMGEAAHKIPWIKTDHDSEYLGIKQTRTSELVDRNGVVKVRVTHYDSTPFDSNGKQSIMKFPNGMPIWTKKTGHPDRPSVQEKLVGLSETCEGVMTEGPASHPSAYKGAFILNKRSDDERCWDKVNSLLSDGIMSEVCAQYYCRETPDYYCTYEVRFVDCKNYCGEGIVCSF